jgi:hypothetical protein
MTKFFFTNLAADIGSFGNVPLLLAGDWNCTLSADPVNRNVDCLNMGMVPNLRHSRYISDLCDEFDIVDLFRNLYPNKRDFTYVPKVPGATNRSRLDFFLVSNALLYANYNCNIANSLQNKMFDHKAVFFYVSVKNKTKKPQIIENKFLNDDVVELIIFSTVAEAYVVHTARQGLPRQDKEVESTGWAKRRRRGRQARRRRGVGSGRNTR